MSSNEEVTWDAPDASGPEHLAMVGQVHIGRWGKLSWFPFEALIGFLLVQAGVGYILNPASSQIMKAPTIAVVTVGVLYALAGCSIVVGLWRTSIRIELLGLFLLEVGFNVLMLMAIVYQSGNSLRMALTFLPLTLAAGTRALSVVRGRFAIQIERT